MKKLIPIALLTLVVALGLALAGCSGGQGDYSKNFQGSWKMTSMAGASEDDMALMEAFGMSVVLELNEDKTASVDMMGEEVAGSWEAKSATECTFTVEGDSATGTLNGEKLTLAIEGEEMTFEKISAEEAAEIKEAAAGMAGMFSEDGEFSEGEESTGVAYDESFAPVTVADDEVCTITLVEKKSSDLGYPGYVADVTNNSDVPLYFTAPFDKSSVDGVMVDFYGGETVQPGKSFEGMFFSASSEDVANIDEMKNVELVIEAWNDKTYDVMGSYTATLD